MNLARHLPTLVLILAALLTFDVYKTYISPDSTPAKLVRVSHYGIVLYAVVLAAFCCILNAVGLNLTWLLTVLAIIVGGAAMPVGLALLWKPMSTVAAIASPWIGLACGLIAWFVTTWKRSGSISVETTGNTTNAVAGNVTSFGVGLLMAVILSHAFPAKYTSTDARHIARSNKIQGIVTPHAKEAPVSNAMSLDESGKAFTAEKTAAPKTMAQSESPPSPSRSEIVDFLETSQNMEPMDPVAVKKGEKLAWSANIVFILVAVILVPFTLFGTGYVYSKQFFTGWVVVSFLWIWMSMSICVIYPVVESTGSLRDISAGVWRDLKALFGVRKVKMGSGSNVC